MPAHQRLGPDGCHCLHDRWKPPIQLKEEQAIAVRELDPTAHLALKHDQLMSERSILSLKSADRPERRKQQLQKEEEQRDHRGRRYVIPSPDQTDEVFGTHSRRTPRKRSPSGRQRLALWRAIWIRSLHASWWCWRAAISRDGLPAANAIQRRRSPRTAQGAKQERPRGSPYQPSEAENKHRPRHRFVPFFTCSWGRESASRNP
jgi:hypothetical protein